jgi:hypothetical protein
MSLTQNWIITVKSGSYESYKEVDHRDPTNEIVTRKRKAYRTMKIFLYSFSKLLK